MIHLTDPKEGNGYTYSHELGIQGMQANLGLNQKQIIRKINILTRTRRRQTRQYKSALMRAVT